ncbi:MAG: nucleoside-diphosphate-sugar epimerase [Oleiphilaceae bacterium]|jgi:nucleoside-diphosphate-sugar epimerase
MLKNTNPIGSAGQIPAIPNSVFITGANGFIGKALVKRYRALGCEVRGMDINADEAMNIVAGDITQPATWIKHANGCELFIHTAAVVSLAADWDLYREVSINGTRKALDVAIESGAQRFLHFSSIAAMGVDYLQGADEKAAVVVGEDYRYGVTKGASEHVVLAAHASDEMSCTIIRPADVYGPGSRAWLIEPLKMVRSGQFILPGQGKGRFTPVYIDDLLDGVMLAAGLDEGAGQIFILAGDRSVSCKQFFSYHWKWAGKTKKIPSLPLKAALAATQALSKLYRLLNKPSEVTPDAMLMFSRQGGFSIEKAKRRLGYAPKVGLYEGMQRSEDWLREIGEL